MLDLPDEDIFIINANFSHIKFCQKINNRWQKIENISSFGDIKSYVSNNENAELAIFVLDEYGDGIFYWKNRFKDEYGDFFNGRIEDFLGEDRLFTERAHQMAANTDRLFLLRQGFEVPTHPGKQFFCWHCALLDGLLSAFPELTQRLAVERVAWPRPRRGVIALVGAENQSLPLLVLADGETSPHQTGMHEGRAFIADKDKILAALTERHGFPELFPG